MRVDNFNKLISNEKETVENNTSVLSIHTDQCENRIVDCNKKLKTDTFFETTMYNGFGIDWY